MKKFTKIFVLCLAAVVFCMQTACSLTNNRGDDSEDDTKSSIDIYNYDGGVGTQWLYNAEERFEELYKDVSFEEGKVGVNLKIMPGKIGEVNIPSLPYDILFGEGVVFNNSIVNGEILDITDIVTAPLSNVLGCTETCSIQDKLFDEHKKALTALDGKYYCLPGYETYSGISYDRDLFNEKSLFIQEGDGATQFTNLSGNLSVGPDGIRGNYDDGLPSSYEEFYNLLEKMVKSNVTPFIYSGQYKTYFNEMLLGVWAAYAGKDEWMLNVNFDSNYTGTEVKANIVTGFNGDNAIIEQKVITPENGYEIYQQESRYRFLQFAEKVLSKSDYISDKVSGVLSHLDTQSEYVFSSFDGAPIAMIMEGSWWYNEAKGALKATAELYPDDETLNRDFAFMPLPRQLDGQVKEGHGTKNTVIDALSSYYVINSAIKDDPVKVNIAKTFLQFLYTDKELQYYTQETGVFRGVKYDIDKDIYDTMCKYYKNIVDLRAASDVIHPVSDNRIFVNASSAFKYSGGNGECWQSTIEKEGKKYSFIYPLNALVEGFSAKEYFQGMAKTAKTWEDAYGKYFG